MRFEITKWWLRLWCVLLPLTAMGVSVCAWRGDWRSALRQAMYLLVDLLLLTGGLLERSDN